MKLPTEVALEAWGPAAERAASEAAAALAEIPGRFTLAIEIADGVATYTTVTQGARQTEIDERKG